MIRQTIPATLLVDYITTNTVPGLSKTVSLVPIEHFFDLKSGKMTKTVTYEATGHCVTCYGILQRNHNVLWAKNITNCYIHVGRFSIFYSPGRVTAPYIRSIPI